MGALAPLAGKTVLVTGAAGFLGARVVALARGAGATVVALVRATSDLGRLPPAGDVARLVADLNDEEALGRALASARPEVVVHAAGVPDWRQDPALTGVMMRTHALGTASLLEAARRAGAGRVVVVGSAGEYGDFDRPAREADRPRPLDPYSASKLAATELALTYHRSFGLRCTVVRPYVLYGVGEPPRRLIPHVFRAARAGGGEVAFTPGEPRRDFVFVDDAAEGALRAAIAPAAAGEIINLGTGVATRVRDAVELAVAASGGVVVPRFGGLPYRPGEPALLVADTARARELLGWSPATSLEDGLRRAWAAYAGGAAPAPAG